MYLDFRAIIMYMCLFHILGNAPIIANYIIVWGVCLWTLWRGRNG